MEFSLKKKRDTQELKAPQVFEAASSSIVTKLSPFWPVFIVAAVIIAILFLNLSNLLVPQVIQEDEITREEKQKFNTASEMSTSDKYSQLEMLSQDETVVEVEAKENVLNSLESSEVPSQESRQKKIDILNNL